MYMFYKPPRPSKQAKKAVVAHIARRYYSTTENWVHTQVRHLCRYQSLILTWWTENLNDEADLDYYALQERSFIESVTNRLASRFLGYYPSFRNLVLRKEAKVIHAHFGQWGYFAIPLAKTTGRPLVTTFYGRDASQLPAQDPQWKERYQDLFKFGDYFLVEGHHLGKQLYWLGCPQHKIIVQHLGVNLDEFLFQPRYLADEEPLRVLVAGRFTEKKGIIYAVEALALLIQAGVNSYLTIIGDASQDEKDQVVKEQILAAIERCGLANRVNLRGMQPYAELKKAYYEHHVLLAPSVQASDGDNEGGAPVTIIEASATGMPIVATYHCDIPEVVVDGISGLLAPERDSKGLASHLAKLARDKKQLEILGQAGRKHIEAQYDTSKLTDKLEQIYDMAIAKH